MTIGPTHPGGSAEPAATRSGDPPPALLTAHDVARRLRIGKSTVYLLCKTGELPHLTIHRSVRIPADALDQWLREKTEREHRQHPEVADR